MSKQVYISADYSPVNGDREVVELLNKWGADNLRTLNFIDMAKVVSGSVSYNNPDCRSCDLKEEFNKQINASSTVIFVVGNNTASREAGSKCSKADPYNFSSRCTPYKQNANGTSCCKRFYIPYYDNDINIINNKSYLQHEFEQAVLKRKKILIVYNSKYYQSSWLPSYMKNDWNLAIPFWTTDSSGNRVGNYQLIKAKVLYD